MTFRLKVVLAAVAVLAACALPNTSLAQPLEDIPGISGLHWLTGDVTLPRSGAIITVPAHARLLTDADVGMFQYLVGGGNFDRTAEAELRFTRFGTIEFQFCNCGYTVADDWTCVKPDEVVNSIRRYYDERGWDEVIDFARSPQFDRPHATITYMLHLRNDKLPNYFEGDALVFGRNGYETLVAVTLKGEAAGTWSELQKAIAAFRFTAGHTFDDHRPSDTISVNHIAAQFATKAGAADLVHRYALCSKKDIARATPMHSD
jgi:uncharacterized membrane-anchored protein